MTQIKQRQGFTLVELLVVMLVTSILIGLSVYGMSVLQRNARNAARAEMTTNLKQATETYFLKNGKYPTDHRLTYSFNGATNTWTICYSADCTDSVEFSGEEYITPSETSDRDSTLYCYISSDSTSDNGYALGYLQESSDIWVDIGNSNTDFCADSSPDEQHGIGF